MIHDPIVEEIHQVRKKLLAECNDNLDQLLDRYKSSEERDLNRVVSLKDVQERSRREALSKTSANEENKS